MKNPTALALLVVAGLLFVPSAPLWAASQQDSAASIQLAAANQVAAELNLDGGYQIVNGAPTFVAPYFHWQDRVAIGGNASSVLAFLEEASGLLDQARRQAAGGDFAAAQASADMAREIDEALNKQARRPIQFWRLSSISQLTFPPGPGVATIAYEDLYPNPGDYDFNDFLANLRITETFNQDGQLVQIAIQITPRARGALYDHALLMPLDGQVHHLGVQSFPTPPVFNGDGLITVRRFWANGELHSLANYAKNEDVPIILDSKEALPAPPGFYQTNTVSGEKLVKSHVTAEVEISLADPEMNPLQGRDPPGIPNYRPVLYVKDTNKYIDVWDIFRSKRGLDRKGYPFGVVIPQEWAWPMEGINITSVYPLFTQYRDYLQGLAPLTPQASSWYLFPSTAAIAAGQLFSPYRFN